MSVTPGTITFVVIKGLSWSKQEPEIRDSWECDEFEFPGFLYVDDSVYLLFRAKKRLKLPSDQFSHLVDLLKKNGATWWADVSCWIVEKKALESILDSFYAPTSDES